jgi:hypothetical protein
VANSPATPATGTITSKVAPAGWSKVFSGTNKAVYRGNEVTGTRMYMRVDDTTDSGKSAGVRGYETMTDVDTGTGPFPTVAQASAGIVITKSTTADSTTKPWVLVADGFEFMLFIAPYAASYAGLHDPFHFGDPKSEMASDPYGCLIYGYSGLNATPGTSTTTPMVTVTSLAAQASHYWARSYTQIGGPVGAGKMSSPLVGTVPGYSGLLPYPAQPNNGLYVAPILVADNGVALRATLKPVYAPCHVAPLGHGALVSANDSPITRRLYSIKSAYSGTNVAVVHIVIDGPSR